MYDKPPPSPLSHGLNPRLCSDEGDVRMPDEVLMHWEEASRDAVTLLPEGPGVAVEGARNPAQACPRERDESQRDWRDRGHDSSGVLAREIDEGKQAAHRVSDGRGWTPTLVGREQDIRAAPEQLGDLRAAAGYRAPGDERDRSSGATAKCALPRFPSPTGCHTGLVYHSRAVKPVDGAESRSGLPTVSVVVPTYKRVTQLETCARALLADPATTEVVVAIDGSGDGSYELATRLGAEDSRVVVFEQSHAGTHAARTVAAQRATGEVVLLVDDDVVAGEGLVTAHALRHREGDHLVVVGYMPVVAADGSSATQALARIYAQEYEAHCREIEADRRLVLLHLWGGNVSLRRVDCLSADIETWNLEHEDQLFGIRCYQAGLIGVFDRSLRAEHRYVREANSFLNSARARGMAKWRLHSLFPELLGELDPDWASAGLPGPVGRLVWWVATPGRSRYVVNPLVLAARAAHRVHFEDAESAAYRLARRVELQLGSRSAASSEPT